MEKMPSGNTATALKITPATLPVLCTISMLFSTVSIRVQGIQPNRGELTYDAAIIELQRHRDFLSAIGKVKALPNGPNFVGILDLLAKKDFPTMAKQANIVHLCTVASIGMGTLLLNCFRQMSEQGKLMAALKKPDVKPMSFGFVPSSAS